MRIQSFKLFVVILVLLALFALPVQAIPTVTLNLLDNDIHIGENFEVQVWANSDNLGIEMLGFGFDVFTTPGIFSYDSYTIESGFDDDSFGPGNVAGSTFAGILSNDVLLATLSFTGLAEGAGNLTIDGPFDGMFSGLYYEFPEGFEIHDTIEINVSGTAPVPEPASILLFGMGLSGLAGFRKKFKKA